MLKPGQVVVMDNATFHKGGRTLATDSPSRLSVAVHEQLIHRTSIRLSDAGLGSLVEFASNSTSLIVYVMPWSMFDNWRPNRLGGCYITTNAVRHGMPLNRIWKPIPGL